MSFFENLKLVMAAVLLIINRRTEAEKGLFVMTSGTKSHVNFFGGVMEALLENGHQITFIGPHPAALESESSSLRQILTTDTGGSIRGNSFSNNLINVAISYVKIVPQKCVDVYLNSEVQEVLQEDFDYIILSLFSTDCFLGYVYQRKIPLIYVSPNVLFSPYSEMFGAPEFGVVSPNLLLCYTHPLTFWERVASTLANCLISTLTVMLTQIGSENLSRKMNIWSPDTPSLDELHKQASIVIINSVRALENPPKSTPPSIIYAGGLHIKTKHNITQDLENWLNESGDDGFILFSLGTAVDTNKLEEKHLQIILNVFRYLKQRIIWKWHSSDIETLPPNVRLASWLPQQGILAHRNIRLFITHGGLFSIQEATYFKVPVLGMPVLIDQYNNIANAVKGGRGLQVTWDELSEENFREAIMTLLTNTSIQKNVEHSSELMKDWPTTPKEEVVYWVGYVIRHKGAKHLQSPLVHLTWYQTYNVDVWFVLSTVFVTICVIVTKLLKIFFNKCASKNKSKTE